MRCRLCWFHTLSSSPTCWRTQKLFIINWQAFSRQTFFGSKGSHKELQRFNEVREQIRLPRLWDVYLLTNWNLLSMYNLTQFVLKFLISFLLVFSLYVFIVYLHLLNFLLNFLKNFKILNTSYVHIYLYIYHYIFSFTW